MNLESVETRPAICEPEDGRPAAERRARNRVQLRWPLSILDGQRDARILSTFTENLSRRGFCCVLQEPLPAGESVACLLKLPPARDPRISQALRCQAQVVWVRVMDDGRFGIGCRIDDYSVVA